MEDCTFNGCRRFGWLVVASIASLVSAGTASAGDGGVVGWVESTRGVPVAGAMVSVFGKGISGGNLVTLSDSQGQFVLPSLPPGSYTLRAIGTGHRPSAAQHIEVVPNRDLLFTFSLIPNGDRALLPQQATTETDAQREWRWLMRHKRRSVLETAAYTPESERRTGAPALSLQLPRAASLADLGALAGNVEFVAASGPTSSLEGAGAASGLGALHLHGRLAEGVSWTLGGLVAENEGRLWRTAAQFVIDPGGGHSIEAGAGYGAADARALSPEGLLAPQRAMGAVFARDRWHLGERLTAVAGARYTYVGFLPESHHADAVLELELQGDAHTVLRGSIATRTLTPGGDLLTLSTVAASPAITWARLEDAQRPSRTLHERVGFERTLGSSRISAHVFGESTQDVLLTTFASGSTDVRNGGAASAHGFGVRFSHRVGDVLDGSIAYTFGRARRAAGPLEPAVIAPGDADFHDLVARLEATFDSTDTRVRALYRLDAMSDDAPAGSPRATANTARFDVQLTQGLPFLQPLTRADWELLLAVRNMFYEASEGGFLDELAVVEPPTRVVGGFSVRF